MKCPRFDNTEKTFILRYGLAHPSATKLQNLREDLEKPTLVYIGSSACLLLRNLIRNYCVARHWIIFFNLLKVLFLLSYYRVDNFI